MAFAAAVANGALLKVWDEPVRSFISGHRVDWLDTFFLHVTRLGSWQVVVIGSWCSCSGVAGVRRWPGS
jgi:hypothetical protein